MASRVDYSLYLVTDSTPSILGSRDLADVVDAALSGGVTVVQYRDKVSSTADLIKTAKRLHTLTKRHNVPLLVNDRVDVALTVGCEGVHIGQDDIDLTSARRLLGPAAIIGVTVCNEEQALVACNDGADYLGIGTVLPSTTKVDSKSIIGPAGVQRILGAVRKFSGVRTVCIGGINHTNVQRVLYQSQHYARKLDGVAVVSAIIAAKDPKQATRNLRALLDKPPAFVKTNSSSSLNDLPSMLKEVTSIVYKVGEMRPLSHNMTNLVVQNFAANVALAIGASPIMANYGSEAEDLSKLGGALVINMGSVTPEGLQNYLCSLEAYNLAGGPVIFDPVGAGATGIRRAAVKTLMAGGYFDLIKGNEGEIKTVFGESGVQQRGVDSGTSTLNDAQKARMVRDLARRERCVVLMTGVLDFISDGNRTAVIHNGHEILGRITGSGCVLGTIMSAMLAVHKEDKFVAAIAGLLHYEISAEIAAERIDVRGPGSFVPALLDEINQIRAQTLKGDSSWVDRAKIELLHGLPQ